MQDFETLRAQVEKRGLFRAQPLFFFLHLSHILLLEALGWLTVWMWGTGWIQTLVCSVFLATAQVIQTYILNGTYYAFPYVLKYMHTPSAWLH